jgi:hypothetical protein
MAVVSKIETKGIGNVLREIAFLKNFLKNGDKWIMDKVGKYALDMLLKRTRQGIDRKGLKFKDKSDGTKSTLQESGKLLNDIHMESSAKIIRIYVGTQLRGKITNFNLMVVHARGLKAGRGTGFHMPVRDPMGFSQSEILKIREFFRRLITGRLRTSLRR